MNGTRGRAGRDAFASSRVRLRSRSGSLVPLQRVKVEPRLAHQGARLRFCLYRRHAVRWERHVRPGPASSRSTWNRLLGALVTNRLHIQRIQRLDTGHKQRFLLTPPKHRFAQGSGRTIRPINSLSGVRQCTPFVPGLAQPTLDYRFPSRSVRTPSAEPSDISANTCPPRSLRPAPRRSGCAPVRRDRATSRYPRCTAATHPAKKAQPVRLHQVPRGNRSFTGCRSAASREQRGGHLRPRMTGCRTLSEPWLKISYFRRRRETCHLELASPFPSLPKVISRLHPQPRLRTRPKRLRQPNRHLHRHRSLLVRQFRQRLPAHAQPFGRSAEGKPKRLQALPPHDPTRLRRPNHPDRSTLLTSSDHPSHPPPSSAFMGAHCRTPTLGGPTPCLVLGSGRHRLRRRVRGINPFEEPPFSPLSLRRGRTCPEPAEREPSRTTSQPSSPAMQSTHALTAMQTLLASPPPAPTRPTTPARRPRVTGPGPPRPQPTSPRNTAPTPSLRPPGSQVQYSSYSLHQRITWKLRTSPPCPQRPLTRPAPPFPHRQPGPRTTPPPANRVSHHRPMHPGAAHHITETYPRPPTPASQVEYSAYSLPKRIT